MNIKIGQITVEMDTKRQIFRRIGKASNSDTPCICFIEDERELVIMDLNNYYNEFHKFLAVLGDIGLTDSQFEQFYHQFFKRADKKAKEQTDRAQLQDGYFFTFIDKI